ncbi:Uncharacterized protein FWK35_00018903 [Aphis craccivora]|uniref:Uncharacterized protein n=1 Tax=Aphis craccivora TaxID=307492 RepID=A0A6G0VZJ6_APHCR|nr:Uncharacterized protein FWK35_00018903 [Aphis craccivora]
MPGSGRADNHSVCLQPYTVSHVSTVLSQSLNFSVFNMAGSIADNSALYKKKTFTYVPPTPPTELIESISYTLDFAARKFVHIGIDPSGKLQVVVHLLTSSRHVHISTLFEKNILVIEAKNREGCRVLLNRDDLLRLQYLECSIFESIVRQEVFIAPLVKIQYEEIFKYLDKKCTQHNSLPKNADKMVVFIKNIQDDQVVKSIPNSSKQIQMCAAEQLAESLLHKRANNSHE